MAIQNITEIEGLGKVGTSYNPFDIQLKELKDAGAKFPYIMDARNIAYMRLNKGSKEGARTCHAPIYAKNSPIIIARTSPLIKDFKMADQAVKANRNNEYFVTKDTEVYDKCAKIAEKDKNKDPEERRALVLSSKENYLIKPNSEEAQALFKDVKEEYFKEFCPNGIIFYPVNKNFVDNKKGSLVEYLLFRHPDGGSGLDGDDGILDSDSGAFGVLLSAEDAKKNLAPKLEDILKITNKYTAEINQENLRKELSKLYK